jgi:hypothetical protein
VIPITNTTHGIKIISTNSPTTMVYDIDTKASMEGEREREEGGREGER